MSFRENVDTGGPLGRAMIVIIGAIAELERKLVIERVRAGMRRAKSVCPDVQRHAHDLAVTLLHVYVAVDVQRRYCRT